MDNKECETRISRLENQIQELFQLVIMQSEKIITVENEMKKLKQINNELLCINQEMLEEKC